MGKLALRAFDFGCQPCDAGFQFGYRKPVEILVRQQGNQIVGLAAGKIVVGVHRLNVDPLARGVNKRTTGITSVRGDDLGDQESIPAEMIAIAVSQPGGPEVLVPVSMPVPTPGKGEVLIRVHAAGVNRPDVMQRQGRYPPPPGAPETPGLEVAGEVVAVGADVPAYLTGHRVCALIAGGGYAEYALAHAPLCLPVPAEMSMNQAAAMPETLFTVWSNLFERAYVADGDIVLVHGGTSGIGTMAIALCRLFGVRILVTCGSDEKCAAARALGATAINYNAEDFVEAVRRETGGTGVTAVLDMVGGDYVGRNLDCLADDGRHVSIAVMGGAKATIFVPGIMQRRLTLTGSTLRPRPLAFKAMLADEIRTTVWPLVEAGDLRPVVARSFPLAEAAAAHECMEAGEHIGKIILETTACV